MPKISDEQREARRARVLDAAWRCFYEHGLHPTSMDMIIRASGLSAGAVYGYFASKEDLIFAAVTTSLSRLRDELAPILEHAMRSTPASLVEEITRAISGFTARDGFNLTRIALHGWSEAQRNERLRVLMRGYYAAFREQLARVAATWQDQGIIGRTATPEDVAQVLQSTILGFVVQAAIVGDADPAAHARGLTGLQPVRA